MHLGARSLDESKRGGRRASARLLRMTFLRAAAIRLILWMEIATVPWLITNQVNLRPSPYGNKKCLFWLF